MERRTVREIEGQRWASTGCTLTVQHGTGEEVMPWKQGMNAGDVVAYMREKLGILGGKVHLQRDNVVLDARDAIGANGDYYLSVIDGGV